MTKKSRTKRKTKQRSGANRYMREKDLKYSKGRGKFTKKVVNAHVKALRASAPILKKSAKWTANKMNNAAAASVLYFGNQLKEYTNDWWNQSAARGIVASYSKKHAAVLGNKKPKVPKVAKKLAKKKVRETEESIRNRLKVPPEMELSDIEHTYNTIKGYFKQFLSNINSCDDYMFTYKGPAFGFLSEKVIFHIDQSSTPIEKTRRIKDALQSSLKKLDAKKKTYGKFSFQDIKDSHPMIKLLILKSVEIARGLIEETTIIAWLASIA